MLQTPTQALKYIKGFLKKKKKMRVTAEKEKNAAFHQKPMKGNLLYGKKKSRAALSNVSPNDRSAQILK